MSEVPLRERTHANPSVNMTAVRERQFVDLLMMGKGEGEAFSLAFPNVKGATAKSRAVTLLAKPHIQEMMAQRMEKNEADVNYVLTGLKREVETSEHPMARVKALEILAKHNRMLDGGGRGAPVINVYLSKDDVERSDGDGAVDTTAKELPSEVPQLRDGGGNTAAAGHGPAPSAGSGGEVGQ